MPRRPRRFEKRQWLEPVPKHWTKEQIGRMGAEAGRLFSLAVGGKLKDPFTDPTAMTASDINNELDWLDARDSKLTDELIAAGRGHERPSDTLQKSDPLALRFRSLQERRHQLRAEIDRRYGPGAPRRLPVRRSMTIRESNPRRSVNKPIPIEQLPVEVTIRRVVYFYPEMSPFAVGDSPDSVLQGTPIVAPVGIRAKVIRGVHFGGADIKLLVTAAWGKGHRYAWLSPFDFEETKEVLLRIVKDKRARRVIEKNPIRRRSRPRKRNPLAVRKLFYVVTSRTNHGRVLYLEKHGKLTAHPTAARKFPDVRHAVHGAQAALRHRPALRAYRFDVRLSY